MRDIKFEYIVKTKIGDKEFHYVELDLNKLDEDYDNSLYNIINDHLENIDEEFCSCSFNECQNHCDCNRGDWSGDWEIVAKRQFTGLKDKNGVEIYEGDILKINGDIYKGMHEIAFYLGAFRMMRYFCEDNIIQNESYISKYCEVIGNIYENPELLK